MKFFPSLLLVFFCLPVFGQSFYNLDFENGGKEITPWGRLQFTKPAYNISKDSTVKYQGHYSLRIKYDTTDGNSDGQILINVPFDVNAKKIKVKCFVKTSSPSDTVWVSITIKADPHYKNTKQKGFWRTGEEWQLIEHEFDVQPMQFPIYQVMINSYTKSKKPVWLDDFSIEADGKNIAEIPSLDNRGEEITDSLTSQQISNLEALGWVWGFLKYFHPAVAAGNYNWDAELFKKIQPVKNAKNKAELSKIISVWIDSLGEVKECKKCDDWKDKKSVTYNIDLEWMKDDRFAEEVQEKLAYLLGNRHQGEGHYVKYHPVRNLDFRNENEYNWRGKIFPNEAHRLHFLFRYWNTIQYFFPYKNIIGRDWKEVMKEMIPRFSNPKDTFEYHVAMNELVNSVNDSHSGSFDAVIHERLGKRTLVAVQRVVGDTLAVIDFLNDSLAKKGGLQKGDIITHVNGRSVKDIIEERLPLVNGGNYPTRIRNLNRRNYITGG